MAFDDWVSSLFMLLALAVFFFKKTKTPKEEETPILKGPIKLPQKMKPVKKKEDYFAKPIVVEVVREHHDALITRPPRIKKVIGSLPNLKTFILCREILDKPKGLQ